MTTIALPRKRIKAYYEPVLYETPYSTYAVWSILCVGLFLGFLGLYQTSILERLPDGIVMVGSMLFVIVAPALAFIFSVISLRRYVQFRSKVKGMFLAYISFFISALYFITAVAMPVVLLGLYIVYVYIW